MTTRVAFVVTFVVLCAIAGRASAQTITVGVFTPSAPFPSTAARVDLASKLGDHLGRALGSSATGRNYARASDFSAAVKRGDVAVALVDATYLATAGGSYTVIAGAVQSGTTSHAWVLATRGGTKLSGLKGKRVIVPSMGGRESEFVLTALFGGEIEKDVFKIDVGPDAASALQAVSLGKADGAIVPANASLPAGTTAVMTFPSLSGPLLVAYGLTPSQRTTVATAALSFRDGGVISGFRPVDGDTVRAIARRFVVAPKRGPLAVPAVRVVVGDLIEDRKLSIERTPVTSFAQPAGAAASSSTSNPR